jgi:alpha,alpha-trehalose phosphorylase
VQSILAAEVGYQDLALEYFRQSIFVDLADLHHNAADGVHVASAGGVWTALVSGFGGMRDHFGELSFDPRLPADWDELSYVLHWQGTRLQVTVTANELRVKADDGDPLVFSVRGKAFALGSGEEVVVPLDGQGPVIPGKPSLQQFLDARRDDGTRLSASVPTVTTTIPVIGAEADVEHGADV